MAEKSIVSKTPLPRLIRRETAWRWISDFTNLAHATKLIDRIDVLGRTGDEGRSQWFVTLDGAPFRWIQKEQMNLPKYQISFQGIDGDFETLFGNWTISLNTKHEIEIIFHLSFDLGLPLLGEALGDELSKRVQAFGDSLAAGIAEGLGEKVKDERVAPRNRPHVYANLSVSGNRVRAMVMDFSKAGMMVMIPSRFERNTIELNFGCRDVQGEVLEVAGLASAKRILFKDSLTASEYESISFSIRSEVQRRHERKSVNRTAIINYIDHDARVEVLDISPGGMRVRCITPEQFSNDPLKLCDVVIVPRKVAQVAHTDYFRFTFAKELTDLELETLSSRLERDAPVAESPVCLYQTVRSPRHANKTSAKMQYQVISEKS